MRKRKTTALLLCAVLAITTVVTGCRNNAGDQESPTDTAPDTTTTSTIEAEIPATDPSEEEPLKKPAEEISAPSMDPEEYPDVDGSTATLPLSIALYQLVTGASAKEAETVIQHTKTTNAYYGLIFDYGADLVLAYEPSQAVYDSMKDNGVKLNIKPIGRDALVFMANERNPVRSLTGQQVKDIYAGRIHNWNEVGGEARRIQAFQRPVNSGSQTLMDKLVMCGTAMDPEAPTSMVISEMGELIESVASYNNQENALGYSVYFYARNMYEKPGLRFMAVDGVMPDHDSIKDGSYPYVNEFYAAIREDEPADSKAHILFDWLTTEDGQMLVESLGYVGMKDMSANVKADFDDHTVVDDAQIHFTEQERFLLSGEYFDGSDGVLVMDDKMRVVDTLEGVSINSNMEMADLTKPLILKDMKKELMGLYDLKRKTWILEPTYDSISLNEEDGQLYGYTWTDEGGRRVKLTVNGTDVIQELIPENVTGSHIWMIDSEQKTAKITDFDGNVVKTIDLKQYIDYQYGYVMGDYYLALETNEKFVLFDENGEPVVTGSSLEGGREFSLGTISNDGKWMLGNWFDTGDSFIYHLVQKKVVSQPEDKIDIYVTPTANNYILENQQGITVYRSDGAPVTTADGRPYEYVLGNGYYAYRSDGKLVVEGGSPKRTYTVPISVLNYGYHMEGDLFYLSGDGKAGIYYGDTCLVEGRDCDWWKMDDFIILTNGQSSFMAVDLKDGSIRYQSNDGSRIVRPFDKFLVISRGNYLCVIDYEGRYALKQLSGDMTDD